jgi:hypothetical protein
LWEALTLFAVFWISILATVSQYADPTNIAWFISLVSVWLVLVIFGIVWQKSKYTNYLVPQDRVGVSGTIYIDKNVSRGVSAEFSRISSQVDDSMQMPKHLNIIQSGESGSPPINSSGSNVQSSSSHTPLDNSGSMSQEESMDMSMQSGKLLPNVVNESIDESS